MFLLADSNSMFSGNGGVILLLLCVLLAAAAVTAVLAVIRRRRYERQIHALLEYLKRVSRGEYDLKIAENEEGEVSILANEIYKIAVQMREQAEQSKQESENLSRALADISHQIKTPLTSIQITLDNLKDNPDMDEQTRRSFLRAVSTQIDRTASLVTSLLQLAKFDSGTIRLTPAEITAAELLREAADSLEVLAELKEVRLLIEGDARATFTGDDKWELEAYKNILKNAVEHSRPGGTVRVMVEDEKLFLKITVSDEGDGIAPEDLKHIFERFYKAEGGAKESFGIGLSLAKTVIEKDGGIITVDSSPGRGTTFTVRYSVSGGRFFAQDAADMKTGGGDHDQTS